MAYSPIEDAYLSRLTAVQFPDMPVDPATAEAAPSVDGMQLAAGPSQTVSDAGAGRGSYAGFDPRQDAANKAPMGEVKAYDPTVREQLAEFLQAGFERFGMDRYRARKHAQTLIGGPSSNLPLDMGIADIVPFLGTGLQTQEAARMGEDAVQSAKQGNYGTAALQAGGAALGLVPGAAGTAKAAMAVGRAGEKLAEKTVPQIMEKGGTLAELLQAMSQGSRSQLTAYHGTPHTVDKFDSKKIGTGEKAQAYGYGLYFAESKDVANQYRINLSYNPDEMKIGGKQINDVYKAIERGATRMPPAKAQAEYEKLDVLERLMMNELPDDISGYVAGLAPETQQWFNKTVKPSFQTYGNLYTVDIPDAMVSKMLDWDKPLTEQPAEVQAALRKAGRSYGSWDSSATGNDLYQDLVSEFNDDAKAASDYLKSQGIPGIRYLDQGSRDAGKGSRNIVVFPGGEDQVKILKQEGKQ